MTKVSYAGSWIIAGIIIILNSIFQCFGAGHWIFNLGILFLGMPHGFYDAIAISKNRHRVKNSILYMLWVGAGVLLWIYFTEYIVYFFLLLTAFHWGTGDFLKCGLSRGRLVLTGSSKVLAFILAVFVFKPTESLEFLHAISGAHFDVLAATWVLVMFLVSVLVYMGSALKLPAKYRLLSIADFLVMMLMVWLLPPLLAISVYYLGFHAVRHYGYLVEESEESLWRVLWRSHAYCALLLGIPFIGWWAISSGSSFSAIDSVRLSSLHFGMLTAFTPPHAFLSWFGMKQFLGGGTASS